MIGKEQIVVKGRRGEFKEIENSQSYELLKKTSKLANCYNE